MNRLSPSSPTLVVTLLCVLITSLAGCGDEESPPVSPTPDAGTPPSDQGTLPSDQGPPPAPVSVATCDRGDLVIASVDTAGETVTLLNPTSSAIVVDSSSAYQLCQGPGRYSSLPATNPVTIAAGDTATFDVSGIGSIDITGANAALALYQSSSFTTRDAMLDYVCWGDGSSTPRLDVAQRVGADGSVLWDDAGCAALAGATEIHRADATDGNAAADYTTTDPSLACN